MSSPKLLCTGAGGFVFSNFVRNIRKNQHGYSIVSIDKCTQPNVLNTIYANKGCPLYIGDVADPHFVDIIFQIEKPDFVIHGAAESFGEARNFVHSNVMGTQIIVEACVKHKVKKLVYVSANQVYGVLGSNDVPWSEVSPLNPRNSYSATKAAGEFLVQAAANTYGLNYNIVRPCNNYGPRQSKRNLIPTIVANILHNTEVPIYGQGAQIRDWIHVQDNCNAILNILEKAPVGETYNISAKQEFSNIEVFHEVCNVLGRGHDSVSFVEDKPGHDFRYSLTNDKIRELGWEPSFKFKDGLAHAVRWYEKNQWFIKG